jgi:flagellar assembly factor FliW
MLIESTRLGVLEVDESRIITFEDGLLGFPEARRFALIQTSPDPVFFWLQSLEFANLAFVVCDPVAFVPDFQASIRRDDAETIGLEDLSEGQVLVIVNRVNGDLTANLLGPLVISTRTLRARQLVLSDKRFSTRHRLVPVGDTQLAARTA